MAKNRRTQKSAKKMAKRANLRRVKAAKHVTPKKLKISSKKSAGKFVPVGLAIPKVKIEKAKKAAPIEKIVDLEIIRNAVTNAHFSNYIIQNVGKRASEVMELLSTPQTDEAIAEKLSLKINEVRRILNILNTDGIVRYNANKDSKGWLTFRWYIDEKKLDMLISTLKAKGDDNLYKLTQHCNDFFLCEKCYKEQNIIFPFETATEMSFKCECNKNMKRVSREEAEALIVSKYKVF